MKRSFSTAPDISKPLLKCSICICTSWLNGSFFGGEHRGFLKEGVKAYQIAPMSPLNSSTFFCLHIYSLWKRMQWGDTCVIKQTASAVICSGASLTWTIWRWRWVHLWEVIERFWDYKHTLTPCALQKLNSNAVYPSIKVEGWSRRKFEGFQFVCNAASSDPHNFHLLFNFSMVCWLYRPEHFRLLWVLHWYLLSTQLEANTGFKIVSKWADKD